MKEPNAEDNGVGKDSSIGTMATSHLPGVVTLHMRVMKTLLADLGAPFVRRYYERALENPDVIAVCATNPKGEVIGWVIGCSDPGSLNAQLRKPLSWFAGHMLRVLLTRPSVVLQLLQSILTSQEVNNASRGGIELTYIGVSPEAQGKGLGRDLLASFVDAARARGVARKVLLTVETDNASALAMYAKAGFVVVSTYQEGRYHRHRLEFPLI